MSPWSFYARKKYVCEVHKNQTERVETGGWGKKKKKPIKREDKKDETEREDREQGEESVTTLRLSFN